MKVAPGDLLGFPYDAIGVEQDHSTKRKALSEAGKQTHWTPRGWDFLLWTSVQMEGSDSLWLP